MVYSGYRFILECILNGIPGIMIYMRYRYERCTGRNPTCMTHKEEGRKDREEYGRRKEGWKKKEGKKEGRKEREGGRGKEGE